MTTEQAWMWNIQDYAQKKDRGDIKALIGVNAQCACGNVRSVQVPPGDFEPKRITEEPCDCGRFICWIGYKTKSVIDKFID